MPETHILYTSRTAAAIDSFIWDSGLAFPVMVSLGALILAFAIVSAISDSVAMIAVSRMVMTGLSKIGIVKYRIRDISTFIGWVMIIGSAAGTFYYMTH